MTPEEVTVFDATNSKRFSIEMINMFQVTAYELGLPEDASDEDVIAKIKSAGFIELLAEWNFAGGLDVFVNHKKARTL